MDVRVQIFHDLSNIFMALKKHTEYLLSEWEVRLPQEDDRQRAKAIQAGLEQISVFLQQYRDTFEQDAQSGLETHRFCDWSDQLQDEILPFLAALHQVEMSYNCRVESNASGILNLRHAQIICDNLIGNAAAAGATRISVELREADTAFDLIVRDNGCGMCEEQIKKLGLGYSSNPESGHGQGFRIILKMAAEMGAIVRAPKSILGLGTEMRVSFMKVGNAMPVEMEADLPVRVPSSYSANRRR